MKHVALRDVARHVPVRVLPLPEERRHLVMRNFTVVTAISLPLDNMTDERP